ncbi:hypothetical protein U0070_008779, partial [Myodes glareolus]
MPHSKHHEYIANKPDISYTEIKTTKSTQKQRKPKAKQSSVMLSEEQLNYAEMTFHRTPQLLSPKRVVRKKRQVFSSQEQSRENLLLDPLLPKEEDGTCYLCSLDWIAFGNNFYHSFREIKSWADSQSSCEEWNSHLVEIDSKAE